MQWARCCWQDGGQRGRSLGRDNKWRIHSARWHRTRNRMRINTTIMAAKDFPRRIFQQNEGVWVDVSFTPARYPHTRRLQNFGMTTFQARRLLREFNEWKTEKLQASKTGKGQQSLPSVPELNTNSNAVVVESSSSIPRLPRNTWRRKRCHCSHKSLS